MKYVHDGFTLYISWRVNIYKWSNGTTLYVREIMVPKSVDKIPHPLEVSLVLDVLSLLLLPLLLLLCSCCYLLLFTKVIYGFISLYLLLYSSFAIVAGVVVVFRLCQRDHNYNRIYHIAYRSNSTICHPDHIIEYITEFIL